MKKRHLSIFIILFLFTLTILFECKDTYSSPNDSSNWDLSGSIEWRSSSGSIFGVYNPETKKTEWKSAPGGISGVFNPKTKTIEWRSSPGGIFGVFTPNNPNDYFEYMISMGMY